MRLSLTASLDLAERQSAAATSERVEPGSLSGIRLVDIHSSSRPEDILGNLTEQVQQAIEHRRIARPVPARPADSQFKQVREGGANERGPHLAALVAKQSWAELSTGEFAKQR